MDRKVEISMLCQIYGNLLTEKQFELLDDYYNNDLSLSEIAENNGITRQAVRDNLKNGEKNLLEFEEKLNLLKFNNIREEKVNNLLKNIDKINLNNLETNLKNELEDIKLKLKEII